MMRSVLLVIGGAVAGSLITLFAVTVILPQGWHGGPITGPVAMVPAATMNHGHLGFVFSNEPGRSLYIVEVLRPDGADGSGASVGDRVTALDGQTVPDINALQRILLDKKPGETVKLGIVREQQPLTCQMRLISMSDMLAAHRLRTNP